MLSDLNVPKVWHWSKSLMLCKALMLKLGISINWFATLLIKQKWKYSLSIVLNYNVLECVSEWYNAWSNVLRYYRLHSFSTFRTSTQWILMMTSYVILMTQPIAWSIILLLRIHDILTCQTEIIITIIIIIIGNDAIIITVDLVVICSRMVDVVIDWVCCLLICYECMNSWIYQCL